MQMKLSGIFSKNTHCSNSARRAIPGERCEVCGDLKFPSGSKFPGILGIVSLTRLSEHETDQT
jgi:hypothetical protein